MTDVPHPASRYVRVGALAGLYFAQGLPFGFFTQSLPIILRQEGRSLGEIGLASLLGLPWALKFLWSPIVDRRYIARFGRRKSWIVPLQIATVLALLMLAAAPFSLPLLVTTFFVINLLASTQDIATDGLAVEILARGERGLGNTMQVGGYRVGMIVGGGAILAVHEELGMTGIFTTMAIMLLVSTLPLLALRELDAPPPPSVDPEALDTTKRPRLARFARFFARPDALQIVALLAIFKTGDAFATAMLRPFLADRGYDISDVGEVVGIYGFAAALLGAVIAGMVSKRVSRRRALVVFGALQAVSVALYAVVAWFGFSRTYHPELIAAVLVLEHFASATATAALFTCMMDFSDPRSAGADFTVQACVVVIVTGLAQVLSGFSADAIGYFNHFVVSTVIAIAAITAASRLMPAEQHQEAG